MASTGQNFAIYDLDQFQLRFNVTDAVGALNGTDAEGWWGVSTAADEPANIKMQKSTDGWTQNLFAPVQVQNHGGMNIGATYIDCLSVLNSVGSYYDGTIELQPSWGASDQSVDYYHELVYDPLGEQRGSTVVATGTLTVYRSAFTQLNFRA